MEENMVYKGFDIKITPEKVLRTISGSQTVECDGFIIEIYGENRSVPFEIFNVAVGFELLENSQEEVEQLVRDYIDLEKLEIRFGL